MSEIIKIMLVDDHVVVRSGLRRLLEQKAGFTVVAEAEDGEHAYQEYALQQPDVVVMDISMPGMGGLETLRRILTRYPSARIVMYSMHENVAFATQAMQVGARGYVAKSGSSEELVSALMEVAKGRNYISPGIAQRVALNTLAGEDDPFKRLSSREFEVFRLLAEGGNVESIAEMLKISQKTVANYQTLLKQKLGVAGPVDLVRLAIRHGVIES
jgi:DNA-binding NarL/FixJ family response regulator